MCAAELRPKEITPSSNSSSSFEVMETEAANKYEPVLPHWFYCKIVDSRERWIPFSGQDSEKLENAHQSSKLKFFAGDKKYGRPVFLGSTVFLG